VEHDPQAGSGLRLCAATVAHHRAFNSSRGALARVPAHIGAGRTETPMRVDPGAGNVAAEAAALGRLIRPGEGCADRVPAV